MNDYGAVEFFCHYKDNIKDDMSLESTVDHLLANIVHNASSMSKSQGGESIPMLYSSLSMKKESQDKENMNSQNIDFSKISVANKMMPSVSQDDTLLANTSTFNARANDSFLAGTSKFNQQESVQENPNKGTASNRVFAS